MENNLYFIANSGCDATTYGLARISDEDFPKFKSLIENLNKNSYYQCMPVISVLRISMSDLREITYNPNANFWDDDYVCRDDVFFLDDKTYTFAKENVWCNSEFECVIGGGE